MLILTILTGIAFIVFLLVLARALSQIGEVLKNIKRHLENIAMGVRAIEKETAPLGPRVLTLNQIFEGLAGGFDSVETTLRRIAS